jgi:AGCS family alanine or glycine:cation symporter
VISWFPYLLSVAVILFAYSTMISWSYYGERCWVFLFGPKSSMYYKALFLVFVFLGSIVSALNVMTFGDTMILAMAFPNILGLYILAPKVKARLDRYMDKLAKGEFKTYA